MLKSKEEIYQASIKKLDSLMEQIVLIDRNPSHTPFESAALTRLHAEWSHEIRIAKAHSQHDWDSGMPFPSSEECNNWHFEAAYDKKMESIQR